MIKLLLLAVIPFMTEHRNVAPKTEVSTNFYGSVTGIVDKAYVESLGIEPVDTQAVIKAANDYTDSATGAIRRIDGSAKMLPKYLWCKDFYDSYTNDAAWYYAQPQDYGHCSAMRDGDFLYRNLDWKFNDTADVIVRMFAGEGRFASVGVANCGTNLTEEIITSGKPSRYYKCLPGRTVDGINENGVCAEVNVVDGDVSSWTGRVVHCMGVVRWALDHGTNAEQTAKFLAANIYFPQGWSQNFHWMIADATDTYIVENGEAHKVTGKTIMTNFRLYSGDRNGEGKERYDILDDGGSIKDVWFTKCYSRSTNPPWMSEFGYNYEDLNAALNAWDRDGATKESHRGEHIGNKWWWQTVHTSIYDLKNLTLKIAVQEVDDWYVFQMPNVGGIKVETDPTVPAWAKEDTKPSYNASEVGALPDNKEQLEENDNFREAVSAVSPPVVLPEKWALADVTNKTGGTVSAADVGAMPDTFEEQDPTATAKANAAIAAAGLDRAVKTNEWGYVEGGNISVGMWRLNEERGLEYNEDINIYAEIYPDDNYLRMGEYRPNESEFKFFAHTDELSGFVPYEGAEYDVYLNWHQLYEVGSLDASTVRASDINATYVNVSGSTIYEGQCDYDGGYRPSFNGSEPMASLYEVGVKPWSPYHNYSEYDLVSYGGDIYRCIEQEYPSPSEFDPSHWEVPYATVSQIESATNGLVSASNPAFADAVKSVAISWDISSVTNSIAALNDFKAAFGDLGVGDIAGGAGTLGGIIIALIGAVTWLKKHKADKTYVDSHVNNTGIHVTSDDKNRIASALTADSVLPSSDPSLTKTIATIGGKEIKAPEGGGGGGAMTGFTLVTFYLRYEIRITIDDEDVYDIDSNGIGGSLNIEKNGFGSIIPYGMTLDTSTNTRGLVLFFPCRKARFQAIDRYDRSFPQVEIYGRNHDRSYNANPDFTLEFSDAKTFVQYVNTSCLSPDTLITMADGTARKLSGIDTGDKILAVDENGNKVADTVTYCDSNEEKYGDETDVWKFSDGTVLNTIHPHEFFSADEQKFKYIADFRVGEHIVLENGARPSLVSHEVVKGKVRHMTLFTEKYNTYFANGVLTGNRNSVKFAKEV